MTNKWMKCRQDRSVLPASPVNIRLGCMCLAVKMQFISMNYSCKTVYWHGPLTEGFELDKLSARYRHAPTFTCKDYTKKVAGIDKQHHISSMNYSCKTVLYYIMSSLEMILNRTNCWQDIGMLLALPVNIRLEKSGWQ